MCVFVCISHTCRNLNFAKNVTTLLHWVDDMKCLINLVKNSSSKKQKKIKKKKEIPTDLPYFCSARYANITIFFFWPNKVAFDQRDITDWWKRVLTIIINNFFLEPTPVYCNISLIRPKLNGKMKEKNNITQQQSNKKS